MSFLSVVGVAVNLGMAMQAHQATVITTSSLEQFPGHGRTRGKGSYCQTDEHAGSHMPHKYIKLANPGTFAVEQWDCRVTAVILRDCLHRGHHCARGHIT